MKCVNCEKELTGRLTKFCCKECKMEYYKKERRGTSYNSEYSLKKDAHGLYLKYKLIQARGGKCECCGYDRNISALQFHHINPENKLFTLDARTIERKSDEEVINEYNKCQLLCANCHAELHHPELSMDNYLRFKEICKTIKRRKEHELRALDIM